MKQWFMDLVMACAVVGFLSLLGLTVVHEGLFFGKEASPEELRTRVTVTKVVDGEYIFNIYPPPWQKHSYAEQTLHNYIEEWLAKNNREALSIEHGLQGFRVTMVTRKI